jgi:thymidine phosphorylase
LPRAAYVESVQAERDGVVGLDALAIGTAAWRLGAGRARKEDAVQAGAGVLLLVDPGQVVELGQPLLELHTDTPEAAPGARAALAGGVTITDAAPRRPPLLLDSIRG